MAKIEVLGYFPKTMQDFLLFCVIGGNKPGETGVFEWFYSRRVFEAHFFNSAPSDPVQVFVATVDRRETLPVPWMDEIKGLKERLHLEGVVGDVSAFPPLNQPHATVTRNQAMDDQFIKGGKRVEKVFAALSAEDRSGFSFTAEQFKAALRGDLRVDRQSILSEIEANFKEPLFEKPDMAKILESVSTG
jgi:hypothetical protein